MTSGSFVRVTESRGIMTVMSSDWYVWCDDDGGGDD